jgi:hypothetical protein
MLPRSGKGGSNRQALFGKAYQIVRLLVLSKPSGRSRVLLAQMADWPQQQAVLRCPGEAH